MKNLQPREKLLLAFILSLITIATISSPISELHGYLNFADQREALGLPRAMDVVSNLPFAGAGLIGLYLVLQRPSEAQPKHLKAFATIFFVGLIVTSIGSAWFHLQPLEGGRLAADRLGMLMAFTGLIGLAGALKVTLRAGYFLVGVVAVAGASAIYLSHTNGNVLPWAVVQFGGLTLILIFATLKSARNQPSIDLWWVVVVYAAAKGLEMADQPVFDWTQHLVSGHSLKHIVASLAAWPVITYFKRTL
jgi:hypothetical protein